MVLNGATDYLKKIDHEEISQLNDEVICHSVEDNCLEF